MEINGAIKATKLLIGTETKTQDLYVDRYLIAKGADFDGTVNIRNNWLTFGTNFQDNIQHNSNGFHFFNNGSEHLVIQNDGKIKLAGALQFSDGSVQTTAGFSTSIVNNYITYPQKINVPEEVKIGSNSLYLGSNTSGTTGTNNYIYSDGGALVLQNNSEKIGIGNVLNPSEKVEIEGNIKFNSPNTGIKFEDGSEFKSAVGVLKNGTTNVTLGEFVQISGDNPMLRIGSLVLQDFTTFTSVSENGLTSTVATPESFVFGNLFWDETKNKYVSIYNRDVINRLRAYCGTCVNGGPGYTLEQYTTIEGGTAIRFNSNNGSVEFLTIPQNLPPGPSGGFELTKEQLKSNIRMQITSGGVVGIGNNPDLPINAPSNHKLLVNGGITASELRVNGSGLYIDGGGLFINGVRYDPVAADLWYQSGVNTLYTDKVIGIGTSATNGYKLSVDGKIRAREVDVNNDTWSDFVFENNYNLEKIDDVEKYIKLNGHLKNIPSAKEVKEKGYGLSNMDAKLLEKIEELTLYIIEQNKRIKLLEKVK